MKEYVILVDDQDVVLGTEEKMKAHQLALLHRAFSVFIYRRKEEKIEFLLQKRHTDKYHSGGLWTNTCCSHPRLGEEIILAGQRRLREEMSFDVPLTTLGSFRYLAKFDNGLTEHELDHILIGEYDGSKAIVLNEKEAQAFRWITIEELKKELMDHQEQYTAWFQTAFHLVLEGLCLNS